MSALAGYFFNNEIISRMEILSICGGFFGVLILTNEHFFHKAGMVRYIAD
jgi:drug/metabolite transporter (DMT)-like permease